MTFDPANPQDPVDVWWETEWKRDIPNAHRIVRISTQLAMKDPKFWARFKRLHDEGRTYAGYPAMR